MSGPLLPPPPWGPSGTNKTIVGPRGPVGPEGRPGRDGANFIQNTDGSITVDHPTGTVTISINVAQTNLLTHSQTITSGGLNVGTNADPGTGIINALTG